MSNVSNFLKCPMIFRSGKSNLTEIEMIVDTSLAVSIIPTDYIRNFPDIDIRKPPKRLTTFAGNTIAVEGYTMLNIKIDEEYLQHGFYITIYKMPIIGRDLLQRRGFNLSIGRNTIIPPIKGFVHKVQIRNDVIPVRQRLRRLPLSIREDVNEHINEILANGVIEEIESSQWVSNIVVVKKKNGKIRKCVDLRQSNRAVIFDSHPIPHIDDLLTSLKNATHFSKLDLINAYHQVALHPESRDLTAFITHNGLFRFCRIPCGLSSAPAFSRLMDAIFQDIKGVDHYFNDIDVYGSKVAEDDEHLKIVMKRLHDQGLQLNEDKCLLRKEIVSFLGDVIDQRGIRPDPELTRAIQNYKRPACAKDVRSSLGTAGFYSKFLEDYSTKVEPLRMLTREGQEVQWTDAQEKAFTLVKDLLSRKPVLDILILVCHLFFRPIPAG